MQEFLKKAIVMIANKIFFNSVPIKIVLEEKFENMVKF